MAPRRIATTSPGRVPSSRGPGCVFRRLRWLRKELRAIAKSRKEPLRLPKVEPIAAALDEALALDLEDGTRRSLLRMRAYASFLGDRPQLVEVAETAPVAPVADVVPISGTPVCQRNVNERSRTG